MAKRLQNEILELNLIINGDRARKEILDLQSSIKGTTEKIKQWEKEAGKLEKKNLTSSEQYKRLKSDIDTYNKTLETQKSRLNDLQSKLPLTAKSYDEVRKQANLTRLALGKAVPGSENWKRLSAELHRTKQRQAELEKQIRYTDKSLCGHLQTVNTYIQSAVGLVFTGNRIIETIRQATDKYLEYDEALTDAMKTTNLTREEITSLSQELAKIDTRTAQNELLALARIGGKLGISGEEDLLGFVRAADKINVALKEDLGGDAEAAIAAIGKMVDIFSLEEEFGIEQSILKVGSAVNSLGMASTANEGYIVDFTKRLAGIAPNADISIDKVLGLAATLDKYGQTSEMSATAIGQTIMAMFKRTETFAGIAKMSVEDFTGLLNRDVNEAFIRVLEGMKGADGGLAQIVQTMEGMKLEGQRASQVLGTMANHTDELRAQQELANMSFRDGTSVIDEFETKNSSATAQIEKLQKKIEEQRREMGERLLPVLMELTSGTASFMSLLTPVVGTLVKYRSAILGLTAAVIAHNVAAKLQNFWSIANRNALAQQTLALAGTKKATILFIAVQNLLAGNLRACGRAFKAFGVALKTSLGPVGWIIMAIEAAIAAISYFSAKSKEAKEAQDRLAESSKNLTDAMTDTTAKIERERDALEYLKKKVMEAKEGSDERREAIRRLNEKYGEYLPNLLTERDDNKKVAEALEEVNKQLERKIKLQARETEEQRLYQEQMDNVKRTVTEYAALYKEMNGKEMSVEQKQDLAKAITGYSNAHSRPGATQETKNAAIKEANTVMTDLGLDMTTLSGGKKKYKKKGTSIAENFRTSNAHISEQRSLADAFFGPVEPGSTGSTGTVGTSATGAGGGTTGGDAGGGGSKWSLSNDEAYLTAKLKLTEQFNTREIATEKELNDALLAFEIKTLEARIASGEESGADLLKLQQDLADRKKGILSEELKNEVKATDEARKTREEEAKFISGILDDELARENKRYQEKIKGHEGNTRYMEAAEREHQAKVAQIKLNALDEQEAQAKTAHDAELTRLQNRLTAKEITEEQYRNDVLAANSDYMDRLKEIVAQIAEVDGTTVRLNVDGLSDKDYAELMLKIQNLIAKSHELANPGNVSVPQTDGSGGGEESPLSGMRADSLLGLNSEQWEAMFDPDVSGMDKLAGAVTVVGAAAQDAMKLTNMWMDNMSRKENEQLKNFKKSNDKKKKDLDDRLKAGLITQAQYNAETEAMDAEYEAKQEELQLKQAKRQKQMSLIQAIINTALSITSALTGPPPMSFVMAGISAAMGAAEIALIASQPVTAGAEEGGFSEDYIRAQDGKKFKARLSPDKRGFVDNPTVLVSENGREYVIPAEGLENPTLMPFINTIETARRNGTLKSLNFESVLPAAVSGRATGGYVSDVSSEPVRHSEPETAPTSDAEMKRLLEKVLKKLDEPAVAYVSMLGKGGIVEQTEKYNRLKKNGRL